MRQSACSVINPIMDIFAAFLIERRWIDSMMSGPKATSIHFSWLGPELFRLLLAPPGLN